MTPTSKEKPKKQVKSALQQKISEFNPSVQMSREQLFKVVLNLQEGEEAPQGEHEVDRIYKQQISRYAGFKNGQLGQGNRRSMKLLMRAVNQTNSKVYKRKEINNQMKNIFQSQKGQASQQNLREHIVETKEQEPQKIQILGKRGNKIFSLQQRKTLVQELLEIPEIQKAALNLRKKEERRAISQQEWRYLQKNLDLSIQETKNNWIKEMNTTRLYNQEISYYQTYFKRQ